MARHGKVKRKEKVQNAPIFTLLPALTAKPSRYAPISNLIKSGDNASAGAVSVANFRALGAKKNVRGGRGVYQTRYVKPDVIQYHTNADAHANVETRDGYGVQLDRSKVMLTDGRIVSGKATRKQRLSK
jgi:hypothetical protein